MRCFSSPGSLPAPMCSGQDDPKGPGFPIRKSADQSLLTAPHGLSQRATSFIASRCQGIHQMPLRRLTRPPVSLGPQGLRSTASAGQNRVQILRDPDSRLRRSPENQPLKTSRSPGQACRLSMIAKLDSRCQTTLAGGASERRPPEIPSRSVASLVEVIGFEPTTSCLQSRRSPN
jgi:hypothetical protein